MSKEQAMKLIADFIHELKLFEVGSIEKGKELFNAVDTLEQTLEDLELYKKAFCLMSKNYSKGIFSANELREKYLDQARKELSNERH